MFSCNVEARQSLITAANAIAAGACGGRAPTDVTSDTISEAVAKMGRPACRSRASPVLCAVRQADVDQTSNATAAGRFAVAVDLLEFFAPPCIGTPSSKPVQAGLPAALRTKARECGLHPCDQVKPYLGSFACTQS